MHKVRLSVPIWLKEHLFQQTVKVRLWAALTLLEVRRQVGVVGCFLLAADEAFPPHEG